MGPFNRRHSRSLRRPPKSAPITSRPEVEPARSAGQSIHQPWLQASAQHGANPPSVRKASTASGEGPLLRVEVLGGWADDTYLD
ncbi:hypothetical protein NDU88_004766 [Pleurodeles waltl]|uniref:Uncharacterized protein n=1 Tax=Pleurodeles waltl TaxID=8319 RepID=A0AAV7TSB9_PLEWA|nr:hypothetical protein NDU88_004766 [Pleurodeles waltl]